MNNLKRVLSLGLVGAMLSGMMIMGAGAATYSDVDEIDNIEAVETMGALNIINGTDKGTFDPDGFVTRGQMAKMIAVAMNGGKEPNFGAKTQATFTDISGHWAESFIEYCTALDIISGRGDGTFDPDGNVTGVEAAKMVLSALGYDAEAYQLVGADWSNNVNRQATQSCKPSLYETVENVTMSQPIDRDTAAQIIWNGLQNKVLEMEPDKVINTGEVSFGYKKSNDTLLNARYGAQIGFGILIENHNTMSSVPEGSIRLGNFILDKVDAADQGNVTFPYDMDLSLIGERVKVIFKDGKQGNAGKPDKHDTIYGVFNAYETEVVNDIVANVKNVENTKNVINIGGDEYDLATKVNVSWNYGAKKDTYDADVAGEQTASKSGTKWTQSKLTTDIKFSDGDTIKAVLNDGKVDKIYVINTTLQYVTAVSADKVTITGVGTIKKADNDVYDDIAKNDVVNVTTFYNTSATDDAAFTVVEKAEVVTGEIEKFKNTDGDKNSTITVDGTAYKVYKETDLVKVDSKFLDQVKTDHIGDEVELYLVNGYVAAVKQISEDAKNYSVIIGNSYGAGVNNHFNSAKIRVMASDGTKTDLEIDKESKDANDNYVYKVVEDVAVAQRETKFKNTLPEGAIVTYDMNKDGTATVKVVGELHTQAESNKYGYDKDTKSLVINDVKTVTAADCVLFVYNEDSYKAYNIRNLGKIASSSDYAYVMDDGKVVAAYLRTATPNGAGSAKVFGMVTADNGYTKVDGANYRQFVVSVNGEDYVVNQKSTAVTEGMAKGKIVSFEPTSDGIYESASDFLVIADGKNNSKDKTTAWAVWVKEYVADEDIITCYTNVTYKLEGDTKVYNVFDKAADGTTLAEKDQTFTYAVDDDVKMYFVDTDNDAGLADGSVSTLNTMTGYKSAYLVLDETGVVVAIIAEVSGEKAVTD